MLRGKLKMMVLVWIFLLFSTIHPAIPAITAGDAEIVFQDDSVRSIIPWTKNLHEPQDSLTIISTQGAIHGKYGISLTQGIHKFAELSVEMPFKREFWTRFYFKHQDNKKGVPLGPDIATRLLTYYFFEKVQKDQPTETILFHILPPDSTAGDFYFQCRLHPNLRVQEDKVIRIPFTSSQPHCVETHVLFTESDSLFLKVFFDGRYLNTLKCRYLFAKNQIGCNILADSYTSIEGRLNVAIDDLSFGSKRFFPIPATPDSCSTEIHDFQVRLKCLASPYLDTETKLSSMHFQLFSQALGNVPFYDVRVMDPAWFTDLLLPFKLDSGVYRWRVAAENNIGNTSDWSSDCTFRILKQRPFPIRAENPWISEIGKRKPLTHIIPEKWYDLHLGYKCLERIAKGSATYALLWLHKEDFTEGNLSNKGGRFIPDKNYVFNLSIVEEEHPTLVQFEKNKPYSMQSSRIAKDSIGLYIDAVGTHSTRDTILKEFRTRMRLLKPAISGKWIISGYISNVLLPNQEDIFSNFVFSSIQVEHPEPISVKKTVIFASAVLLIFVSVFFIHRTIQKKRRKKSLLLLQSKTGPNILRTYIESHLTEKFTVQEVILALSLTQSSLRNLLNELGTDTFPEYVNFIKIEKAKELLLTTRQNIAEIGFALGYENTNYFIRIFRRFEQCTPKEFRQNHKQSASV